MRLKRCDCLLTNKLASLSGLLLKLLEHGVDRRGRWWGDTCGWEGTSPRAQHFIPAARTTTTPHWHACPIHSWEAILPFQTGTSDCGCCHATWPSRKTSGCCLSCLDNSANSTNNYWVTSGQKSTIIYIFIYSTFIFPYDSRAACISVIYAAYRSAWLGVVKNWYWCHFSVTKLLKLKHEILVVDALIQYRAKTFILNNQHNSYTVSE